MTPGHANQTYYAVITLQATSSPFPENLDDAQLPQLRLQRSPRPAHNARMRHSAEYTAGIYLREEDFVEEWAGTVEAVLPHLGGWRPNYNCNDQIREARRLALVKGEQTELVFDEAAISNGRQGLAAIDIHLRSSTRLLIVRLRWEEGLMIVETRLDGKPCR
jgi:hypothetical protein